MSKKSLSKAMSPDEKNIEITILREQIEAFERANQSIRDNLKLDIARFRHFAGKDIDQEGSVEELEENAQEAIQENLDEIAKLERAIADVRRGNIGKDME